MLLKKNMFKIVLRTLLRRNIRIACLLRMLETDSFSESNHKNSLLDGQLFFGSNHQIILLRPGCQTFTG